MESPEFTGQVIVALGQAADKLSGSDSGRVLVGAEPRGQFHGHILNESLIL